MLLLQFFEGIQINMKKLKDNEIRVIKVGEEAIRELIYETIMEKGISYFNLPKKSHPKYHIHLDLNNCQMICVAETMNIPFESVNYDTIDEKIDITTDSFFTDNRYVSKYVAEVLDDDIVFL